MPKIKTKAKIGLISLGCPKNLVDSEVMLGLLKKEGYCITEDFNRCDAAVINTCSFIEDAKKESIDLILRILELKKEKKIRSVIVAGCLPQRYLNELKKEFKEVDAFLGTNDFSQIVDAVKKTLNGGRYNGRFGEPVFLYGDQPRSLITPRHFAYLKVAEGCNNRCSYCVIPDIRGKLRSRPVESILAEARRLSAKRRLSEINLIGQDITSYGADLYGRPELAQLVKKLAELKPAKWIRLLYTHPGHYTDELIDVVRDEPSVCKYLDLPLQHISDRILRLMNRGVTKKDITGLIERLRRRIPNLAIRTTFIVGFPGETDAEFMELLDFVKEEKFERLGVFDYSREEGTPAYRFKDQVPEDVKKARLDEVMKLQQEIARGVNTKFMGRQLEVLIDEADKSSYVGRTEYDAPEVDGNCFIKSKKAHKPGDFVKVKITDTLEYDLVGEEV